MANDEGLLRNHIYDEIGDLFMSEVEPHHISALLEHCRTKKAKNTGKPLSPDTIHHVFKMVRRVYNWCIEEGRIFEGRNPCGKMKIGEMEYDNSTEYILTREELDLLIAYVGTFNPWLSRPILFAIYSGRRIGEILGLTWSNINADLDFISLAGVQTKNKKSQKIAINNAMREQIEAAREAQEEAGIASKYVFPSSAGNFYHSFNRNWQVKRNALYTDKGVKVGEKWFKIEGRFRLHDIRHTYATYLASSGKVDIYTLQRMLGHKSIKMTQRYADLFPAALKAGAAVADEVI